MRKATATENRRQAPTGPAVTTSVPRGFKAHQTPVYAMAYPDDWSVQPAQDGVSATLAAADGIVRGANGQNDIGHGVLTSFVQPSSSDINQATDELLKGILQGNPSLKTAGSAQSVRVVDGGSPACWEWTFTWR